ncbi:hypothetical protein WJX77_001514 [Trebouxia sp. C0004]
MAVDFDYYQALGLTRNATDVDVKKAKLALVYHPDRNASDTAKQDFLQICEAYDILSNPHRKGILDLHGEQALKAGMAETQPGTGWTGYSFDPSSGPEQVFSNFFGTSNPYEALNGLASSFESMAATPKLQVGKQSTHLLLLSLEEMYHGCVKKVTHERQVMKADGTSATEQRELSIDVRPGLPEGTQFVFEKEGDVGPKNKAGPVMYVLKAQQHPRFTCRGSDLLYTAQIPLYQALCGTALPVDTLDGRTLSVPVTDIVSTGDKALVPQEGMRKASGGKGDLHITFEVVYPVSLTEHQRTMLKAAFFLPPKLDAKQTKALRSFETAFRDETHGVRRHVSTLRLQARHAAAAGQLAQEVSPQDRQHMQHALSLAKKALGKTFPNPAVGCVIVKQGKVIGEGYHPKAGEPHAEVFALRAAGQQAAGATAYVTLEPCNHYGKTPPCSQALVDAKVAKVFVGVRDPNPLVNNAGVDTLTRAGINVAYIGGEEEQECFNINSDFMERMAPSK